MILHHKRLINPSQVELRPVPKRRPVPIRRTPFAVRLPFAFPVRTRYSEPSKAPVADSSVGLAAGQPSVTETKQRTETKQKTHHESAESDSTGARSEGSIQAPSTPVSRVPVLAQHSEPSEAPAADSSIDLKTDKAPVGTLTVEEPSLPETKQKVHLEGAGSDCEGSTQPPSSRTASTETSLSSSSGEIDSSSDEKERQRGPPLQIGIGIAANPSAHTALLGCGSNSSYYERTDDSAVSSRATVCERIANCLGPLLRRVPRG